MRYCIECNLVLPIFFNHKASVLAYEKGSFENEIPTIWADPPLPRSEESPKERSKYRKQEQSL
jgi:hypothetical protein